MNKDKRIKTLTELSDNIISVDEAYERLFSNRLAKSPRVVKIVDCSEHDLWYRNKISNYFNVKRCHFKGDLMDIDGIDKNYPEKWLKITKGEFKGFVIKIIDTDYNESINNN